MHQLTFSTLHVHALLKMEVGARNMLLQVL